MLQLTPQIKGTAFVYVVNKQSTLTNDSPTYVEEAFEAFKN